jgi:predicted transcriptional regulator YheO
MEMLKRNERLEIIRHLDKANVFETRNAAPLVARALGISRASVYNLLQDVHTGD